MMKTLKAIVLTTLLAALLLLLAACGKPLDTRIVGTWQADMTDDAMMVIAGPLPLLSAGAASYEITFSADGTCTATMLENGRMTTISSEYSGSGPYSFSDGKLEIGFSSGSYECTVDGDVMTWTWANCRAVFHRR